VETTGAEEAVDVDGVATPEPIASESTKAGDEMIGDESTALEENGAPQNMVDSTASSKVSDKSTDAGTLDKVDKLEVPVRNLADASDKGETSEDEDEEDELEVDATVTETRREDVSEKLDKTVLADPTPETSSAEISREENMASVVPTESVPTNHPETIAQDTGESLDNGCEEKNLSESDDDEEEKETDDEEEDESQVETEATKSVDEPLSPSLVEAPVYLSTSPALDTAPADDEEDGEEEESEEDEDEESEEDEEEESEEDALNIDATKTTEIVDAVSKPDAVDTQEAVTLDKEQKDKKADQPLTDTLDDSTVSDEEGKEDELQVDAEVVESHSATATTSRHGSSWTER
jgi:hypothetical protein